MYHIYETPIKTVYFRFSSPLAPSAYAPEKVNLKHTPAFSFGLKIKQERYSETPGRIKQIT